MIWSHEFVYRLLVEFVIHREIIQYRNKICVCCNALNLVMLEHVVLAVVGIFSKKQHQLLLKTCMSYYILLHRKGVAIILSSQLDFF